MATDSLWWYAPVAVSPDPDAGELVNVALLFGNGALDSLEFDEGLPRLTCLVDSFERRLLEEMLQSISMSLSKLGTISQINTIFGPQIRVADPRPLYDRPGKDVRDLLRRQFLRTGKARERTTAGPRTPQIDRTLQKVLSQHAFDVRIERRVSPRDLFPRVAERLFRVEVPSIDRALRSGNRDLLIGGAKLNARHPDSTIRGRGVRLGQAFWHYRSARGEIEQLTGRQVRTVGLIFNGATTERPAAREAVEYLEHIWAPDVDLVIHGERESDLVRLQEEVSWVASASS
jgi:hypothetical protein